jgi:hypothetical protein
LIWRFTTSLALVLSAGSVLFTVLLFTDLRDEIAQRRDQACVITEREQDAEVQALVNTYRYLSELTGEQLHDPLNRAVLRQLPMVEARARADNAPPYCDEEGVGLPEPDRRVPERPRVLWRLTGDR